MMHDWSPAVVFWMQRLGARVGDARLGAFHDAVLELGSVPLPIVTAWIDGFITEDGKGHYRDME